MLFDLELTVLEEESTVQLKERERVKLKNHHDVDKLRRQKTKRKEKAEEIWEPNIECSSVIPRD